MVAFENSTPVAHVSKLKVGETVALKSDQAAASPMIVAELRGPVKGQVRVNRRDGSGQLRSSYYYEDMLRVVRPIGASSPIVKD